MGRESKDPSINTKSKQWTTLYCNFHIFVHSFIDNIFTLHQQEKFIIQEGCVYYKPRHIYIIQQIPKQYVKKKKIEKNANSKSAFDCEVES